MGFTPESGPRRLAQALVETDGRASVHEEGLSTKDWGDYEVRFVNCWQPLREVYKKPLMVCDTQSLDPADLIARDFIFRERVGNTYGVRFNKDQKWYYFPRMTPKEVLVFKVFDSNTAAAKRFTPHSGFTDLLDDEPFPRQSVEIRCAAVFPKKTKKNTRGQTRFTLAEPGEKPYRYMYKDPEHTLKKGEFLDSDGIVSACRNQMTELDVLDGRGEDFSVQQNGFQLVTHSTPMPQSPTLQELDDLHQWVRRHALPAACKAVRAAFGDEQPLG